MSQLSQVLSTALGEEERGDGKEKEAGRQSYAYRR